jgi:aldose 1-epimerase
VRFLSLLSISFFAVFTAEAARANSAQRAVFGQLADGTTVEIFTLTNQNGLTAKVITFGATLTELRVPDRHGSFINVVRSTDQLDLYVQGFPAASVMGRVAGRIAKGRFTLDGHDYQLSINSGHGYHIHGGKLRFDNVVWKIARESLQPHTLTLTHTARDGEDGYPGTVEVSVTYTLTENNALRIDYAATTDKPTPINLTNHAYFNLSNEGDLASHELLLNAGTYTPLDEKKLPTGEIAPVKGTPFDFTSTTSLGARLRETPHGHFDHNFVINRKNTSANDLVFCARVTEPKSGRVMETWTTEPGVQFVARAGGRYSNGTNGDPNGLFCLETQHFPDSVNHPHFPSTIFRPGETFRSTTEYRFSTR